MLYDLYNFLTSKRFVELLDWTEYIIENYGNIISEKQKYILEFIQNKEIQNLIEFLKKESFTAINNEFFNLILEELEKNKEEISAEWNFIQNFNLKESFLNIILENDILIYQGLDGGQPEENIRSFEELENFSKDPNKILAGGKIYVSKGLSSIDKIQGIMKESNYQREYSNYQKYDKIVQFIEGLNLSLQKLFSMNQIGVIIFKNEIYLIRWVQYIGESQIISQKSNVEIMENFGVKIGVQLKENLELGNLVIFKNKNDKNEQDSILRTLFSLDQDFFKISRGKRKKKNFDLKIKEDCEEFVKEVLSRIESGLLMLNNKNITKIKNSKDLNIYTKISLQRVEGIDSINQRINILRDLLNLDINPNLKIQIKERLEDNYCNFLKEQFKLGNVRNIPSILKSISKLELFLKRKSLLIHTMVYLFDSYYSDSETIILSVDLIIKYWKPSNELIKILEKPQVVAITNKIIEQIRLQNFSEIWSYITKYLKEHPYFRSYNIFTLMLEILIEIYHKRYGSTSIFPNIKYLNFFQEYIIILKSYEPKFEKSELSDLVKKFREKIQVLSNDLEFIAYMNDNITDFLVFLSKIDRKILSERILYKILNKFAENGPLVMFYKRLPNVGEQIFNFLTTEYKNIEMTLEFSASYVDIFTNSANLFQDNPKFFKNATVTLNKIKPWLEKTTIQPILLLSIRKKIKVFLNQWYISGNLPENEFETHKHIIDTWIDFVQFRENLQNMLNILYIKDFIWSCEHFNLEEMQEKYSKLPDSVFEINSQTLLREMKGIMNWIFEDYIQYTVFQKIFSIIQEDIDILKISKKEIKHILKLYNKTLRIALINIVQKGYSHKFKNIFSNLGVDIVLCDKKIFEEIYQQFIAIYEMTIQEGERFNLRIEMMKISSIIIEKTIPDYEKIIERKIKLLEISDIFLPKTFLVKYLADLKQGTYFVFQETQKWLINMSPTNYLTYKSTFSPLKLLFENILEQNSEDKQNLEKILTELKSLSKDLFENQKMLGENKKKYFIMMKSICGEDKYPDLMKTTTKFLEFIEELADIESLYYTISGDSTKKIDKIMDRTIRITKQYPHFFSPWFILANSYAIKEDYPKAIEAYEKALKYDSNQANYARMYNNLLVVYLSQKMYKETIELIKSLNIGIKTFPHISDIIRRVEELTGEHLLGEN